MSIWSKLIEVMEGNNNVSYDASRYAIVDVEVGLKDHKIHDIGAVRFDGAVYHGASKRELLEFLRDVDYLWGHNIIHHDAKYLFHEERPRWMMVDTLYMSPLLFPERPYHRLVKDDKLMSEQMNKSIKSAKEEKNSLLGGGAGWSLGSRV